jgi:hypothetical protein
MDFISFLLRSLSPTPNQKTRMKNPETNESEAWILHRFLFSGVSKGQRRTIAKDEIKDRTRGSEQERSEGKDVTKPGNSLPRTKISPRDQVSFQKVSCVFSNASPLALTKSLRKDVAGAREQQKKDEEEDDHLSGFVVLSLALDIFLDFVSHGHQARGPACVFLMNAFVPLGRRPMCL